MIVVIVVDRFLNNEVKGSVKNCLIEIKSNVYLGDLTKRICDNLFKKVKFNSSGCILCFSEFKKFNIKCYGSLKNKIINLDGIYLTNKKYKI